jgi:hypothetical protein
MGRSGENRNVNMELKTGMSWKTNFAWLLVAVVCMGTLVGCKPADKKTPEEPAAHTTES